MDWLEEAALAKRDRRTKAIAINILAAVYTAVIMLAVLGIVFVLHH
jgi:ABC-type siderophore export system fused ATPase/permease subunit